MMHADITTNKRCGHLPHHPPLLGHFRVLSGHSCQEAGGATALGTADADKVPRPHHISRGLCSDLMGNHCVLADLLKDLLNNIVKIYLFPCIYDIFVRYLC